MTTALLDVVGTAAEAQGLPAEPLLVLEPLAACLDGLGLGRGEVKAERIGAGHSNATFALERADGTRLVLRRPPRGPVPKGTHNVLREARVQLALSGLVPVPRILAAVEDPGVIGAPFYLMEHLDGTILTDRLPAELDTPEEKRRLGELLVDGLADLHAVDWAAAGLGDFGRPEGYLDRQIETFSRLAGQYRSVEGRPLGRIADWLRRHRPARSASTVVHGDYRLGNIMLAPGAPARPLAVLDWEMATLGDPLADLGYVTRLWTEPGEPAGGLLDLQPFTRAGGFPTRAELAARYGARAGRDVGGLAFYEVLTSFKGIVIFAGNRDRALDGSAPNAAVLAMSEGLDALIAETIALCESTT